MCRPASQQHLRPFPNLPPPLLVALLVPLPLLLLLPSPRPLLARLAPAGPERPPFAATAAGEAAALGHGAIATAEKRGGRWDFAIAGQPFPAGHAAVPAGKVLFEIGSISKVFTGILLADAVVEGKLGLGDTLAQRLPLKFERPETGAVTLEQLAAHASCLPRLPDNMLDADLADPYAGYDRKALFAYLATAMLDGKPPCAPAYSNLGFGVLGVVLETAYGKSWAALVREKIALPLGMADTAQDLSPDQAARFAAPWAGGKPAHEWTFQAMAGAGALRSTAADMSKLADALLAGARGPLGKAWPVLAADRADMPAIGGKVGLGLEHLPPGRGHESAEGDRYGHEGGTGGYQSLIEVWPASGRAIVVLASNGAAAPRAWLARWQAAGDEPVQRREIAVPPAALDAATGVYAIDKQARITILRRGDGLVARLTGQPFFPIFPSAGDEYFYKVVDAQLSLHRNAAGKVDRLTLHQNGRDVTAVREAGPPPHVEFPAAAALADYAGDYDFGAFQPGSTFSVSVSGETLLARLTGQPASPVFAVAKDRFEYDVVQAALTFERDAAGKVVAVVLHQNGLDKRAPRR
ncbi:MAG TPA: serine hydrolase [Thermoanaerobaculia bacterium]|nr:serine hydrolase [Thermoanaerobaculia bacterium]